MKLRWFYVFLIGCVFVVSLQARSGRWSDRIASARGELAIEHHIHVLPRIEVVNTVEQPRTNFTGIFHSEYTEVAGESDAEMSLEEEQAYLSYEIAWPKTGRRLEQFVRFRPAKMPGKSVERTGGKLYEKRRLEIDNPLKNNASPGNNHRRKRRIYGRDNRKRLSHVFSTRFPFSSVVKVSTGCTGTLVSPRHVLTAAHCIHNQKDYVKGYKKLAVGYIRRFRTWTWRKVKNTFLPRGWLSGNQHHAAKFDYALLELQMPVSRQFFALGISENNINGRRRRIRFANFDERKRELWYRTCLVTLADKHVLYHYCDARPGSSGAGVYVMDYDTHKRSWRRQLIGVFSGYRFKNGYQFNAAIRFDSAKYTEICKWMGSYASHSCQKKFYVS